MAQTGQTDRLMRPNALPAAFAGVIDLLGKGNYDVYKQELQT